MKKTKLSTYILCAFFAALTAVLSQIAIPLEPVPLNLATLSVFLAGGVLGAKYGALSQIVYVALGAVGVPVFATFVGGIGILVGPTGGYIIGYIAAAWMVGLLADRFGGKIRVLVPAMIAGILLCYLLGTAWFMYITGTDLAKSLLLCVVPFLPGDALKIAVGALLASRLREIRAKRAVQAV